MDETAETSSEPPAFDAILLVSFGGPEGVDEVIPFLENVLRGRNVPRERMLEVAEHYYQFGGVSPINRQNRELIACLENELAEHEIELPIYFGNRNWDPMLAETVKQMGADGMKHALALFTSSFSSYSACRQYRENLTAASEQAGATAPSFHKIRMYFNHPGFIETMADRIRQSIAQLPANRRDSFKLLFTAHSIPLAMADHCDYVDQLNNAAELICKELGVDDHALVYQSRSGPPHHGSSRMSAITSSSWLIAGAKPSSFRRSASSVTTWRYCLTSMRKRPKSASGAESTWCGPRQPERIHVL